MHKLKPLYYLLALLMAVGYGLIAYAIPRYETSFLLTAFIIIFLSYVFVIQNVKSEHVFIWIVLAFLFRLIFLLALPSLSDDFYRFIWDGRLWNAGYHPFVKLPSEFVQLGIEGIDQSLFQKLNSPDYFTIYPPVSQLVFWGATKIFPHSILGAVIAMRVTLLLAELGNIFLMYHLLKKFSLPVESILFYALNPLVIIELTGNLHFEALVISFLLLAVFWLVQQRWLFSAASLALAIGTKLVPILFVPVFISIMGIKNSIRYGLAAGIILLICFTPLFNREALQSMSESVGLYFNKFEFNASLYYLVREVGFWYYGYNIIQTVGWKLGLIAALLIIFISFRRGLGKNPSSYQFVFTDFIWVLGVYFLFTTTLHPWYITTLLACSVFTVFRFPVLWSGLIFLTYAGYSIDSFHENYLFTTIEYVLVIGYLIYELRVKTKLKFSFTK